jgi:hypothetical protein
LYATANAPRSLQKATHWSGTENADSSKEIGLSRYQSIDMLRIVVSVKFDGGLSISVLKNKQLYKKKWTPKVQKVQILSNPAIEERTDLGKSFTFLEPIFLVNRMDNPTSNLT